jgi:lambda repressor-like predicted transcriptional regulator
MSTPTTTTLATDAPQTAVRATWKQHGRPVAGFVFYGTEVKTASTTGKVVGKVVTEGNTVTLKGKNGRAIESFAPATKFWAVVPEDAERQPEPVKADPKAKADKLPPVQITAPKGGDQTVAPIKGKIAKAIAATGESIMAISRKHGLNPSQMRRLSLDTVAKVDLVRAELIAKALGCKLADLFGEPSDKAKVKPAAKNGETTTTAPATTETPAAEGDQPEAGKVEVEENDERPADGAQAETTTPAE